MPIATTLYRAAASALLCAAGAAFALPAATARPHRDEATGALVGELMFNADLLTALDALCPRGWPRAEWHAALPRLPAHATTPDLVDLSRRLGDDAGRRLVEQSGGCASKSFREAYEESRENFDGLVERWQQIAP